MKISTLEYYTQEDLIKLFLRDDKLRFSVNDSYEMLNLKYIHYVYQCLEKQDQELLDNFPEFDSWWVKPLEEITEFIESKDLYVETSKFLSVLLAIFVDNDKITSILARNMTSDVFCSLIGWQHIKNVDQLYNEYTGEITEELMLTLEGFGFDYLLIQKLPMTILYNIFSNTHDLNVKLVNKEFNLALKHNIILNGIKYEISDEKLHKINYGNLTFEDSEYILEHKDMYNIFRWILTMNSKNEAISFLVDRLVNKFLKSDTRTPIRIEAMVVRSIIDEHGKDLTCYRMCISLLNAITNFML